MEQNKSLRHFERFRCNIRIFLHVPTKESIIIDTFNEFICAYSLRGLIACVKPHYYLAGRWCRVELSFEVIPDSMPDNFTTHHPLCMHNYQDITAMVVRTINYTLAIETITKYL